MIIPSLAEARPTLTVKVSNIPPIAIAKDLQAFLESLLGPDTLFAVEIFTERDNWKSRGHGRVQFESPEAKIEALSLSQHRNLLFKGYYLSLSHSLEEIIIRPVDPVYRVGDGAGSVLFAGIMIRPDCMGTLESWVGMKLWFMPDRKTIHFFVDYERQSYKLEVQFGDVLESRACCLDRGHKKVNAILLKVWFVAFFSGLGIFALGFVASVSFIFWGFCASSPLECVSSSGVQ